MDRASSTALITALAQLMRDLVSQETLSPEERLSRVARAGVQGYTVGYLNEHVRCLRDRLLLNGLGAMVSQLGTEMVENDSTKDIFRSLNAAFCVQGVGAAFELFAPEVERAPFDKKAGAPVRVFISHSWRHSRLYYQLTARLRMHGCEIYDHSIPIGRAIEPVSEHELEDKLYRQIRGVSVVMILAGPGVERRRWVRKEIEIANALGKPVVAVQPHGRAQLALPSYIDQRTVDRVGWRTPAIARRIESWSR